MLNDAYVLNFIFKLLVFENCMQLGAENIFHLLNAFIIILL